MSLEVIYVTRHGFRSPWVVDPSTGSYTASFRSPTGLPTDPALTSHGVEQANELADHLLDLKPPIEQVYSSPYYRCLQTIMPFVTKSRPVQTLTATVKDGLEDRPFTIRAEKGLSEWYGLAHFEHPTSAPLSELRQFFPKLDANYVSGPPPPRNGETISQLHHRVAASIQAIITRSDQEGNKAVLVCSHAAVVITLGRVLTGQLPDDPTVEDFKAHTSGLSIYRRQRVDKQNDITATTDGATQGGWTCEANSDCSFLRCGEERGWRFSGDESFIDFDHQALLPSEASRSAKMPLDATRFKNSKSSSGSSSKL